MAMGERAGQACRQRHGASEQGDSGQHSEEWHAPGKPNAPGLLREDSRFLEEDARQDQRGVGQGFRDPSPAPPADGQHPNAQE